MGKIKKGEFIELEYTGRTKKDNNLFDTTYEKIAKSEKSYNPKVEYGPIIACIGEKHVINGLDSKLEGKEIGKEYSINISVDEGFGKKGCDGGRR